MKKDEVGSQVSEQEHLKVGIDEGGPADDLDKAYGNGVGEQDRQYLNASDLSDNQFRKPLINTQSDISGGKYDTQPVNDNLSHVQGRHQ